MLRCVSADARRTSWKSRYESWLASIDELTAFENPVSERVLTYLEKSVISLGAEEFYGCVGWLSIVRGWANSLGLAFVRVASSLRPLRRRPGNRTSSRTSRMTVPTIHGGWLRYARIVTPAFTAERTDKTPISN